MLVIASTLITSKKKLNDEFIFYCKNIHESKRMMAAKTSHQSKPESNIQEMSKSNITCHIAQ